MAGQVVFWVEEVKDSARLAEYQRTARPTVQAAGGKVSVAYGRTEVVEGPPMRGVVVIEFPTYEAAVSWYHSAAYQAAKVLREGAATVRTAIVESRA